MINFIELNKSQPYKIFKNYYDKAILKGQPGIEAMAISSYCQTKNEVDSRFVNLKYISNTDWIFFTNYLSPKASQFKTNKQISVLLYWESINVQIRIKAIINKTDRNFSDKHFLSRDHHKNILAIVSEQSKEINSYNEVRLKVKEAIKKNLVPVTRPEHWGGFTFQPYYFEFWEGNKARINKREVFKFVDNKWNKFYLQP
jgi:pyridoxamine 5'-phosphate oxidase